jgi:N-acetylglucosaminyldiphosphoundecaprenol N-acetyl-beta-D-mannosaminyltransferase
LTEGRYCFRHHSLNATKLSAALCDDRLFTALARADCLSADGMGIVWAARLLGIRVSERVTGIDLMTDLLAQFAQDGVRVFLLGARQDVLDRLRVTLPARFPGLIIAGTHHGYELDDEKLAGCVAKARPDALFVALPSPRKERFVDHFAAQTGCRFAMGVGGAFDVLAGKIRRAPVIMQRAGLEFVWRILCQPRYMIPRYARGLYGFQRLVLPRVTSFQLKRLRSALRRSVMVLAGLAILVPVGDLRAQSQIAPKFDIENRQAAISWIEAEIAKVKDPDDVRQVIEAILDDLLAQDDDFAQPATDWQETESRLEALLVLVEVAFGGGSNRFLMETIFGGVVLRLIGLHPDPVRLSEMVRRNASELAERLLEDRPTKDADFTDQPSTFTDQPQPGAPSSFFAGMTQSENRGLQRYALLFADGLRNPTANSLWDVAAYEDPTGLTELEDASPR